MIKKRGKFLTVLFSLCPGAGHMYMGFFKMGISLMSVFLGICFFASWLGIGPLMFILPVLWFYSFFDALNKLSLSDEEFYSLEDRYLFSLDSLAVINGTDLFRKNRLYIGIGVLILGIYMLWDNIDHYIYEFLPSNVAFFFSRATHSFPQILVAALIIYIGYRLIRGKKNEGGKA